MRAATNANVVMRVTGVTRAIHGSVIAPLIARLV